MPLTVGLSGAYGPSVRVNALPPRLVGTDIAAGWAAKMRARATADMPLGRMGQATDCVGPALWLATSVSAFATGTLIRVNGGLYRQIP